MTYDAQQMPAEPDGATTVPGTDGPAPDRRSGLHPVNVGHLVVGIALLGLVAVWLIVVPLDLVEITEARWLLPLPWLVAGAIGVLASLLRGRFPQRP